MKCNQRYFGQEHLEEDTPEREWVYTLDGTRYDHVGDMNAICLRPYFAGVRDDKAVNPTDLRLEQVSHLVDRVHRIEAITA